jgi:inner membrane protein
VSRPPTAIGAAGSVARDAAAPASARRAERRALSPAAVAVATAVFLIADVGDQLVSAVAPQAVFDETAHALTTLLVLWAIGGALWERMLVPALIASVAIDVDHIPGQLGYRFLTAGTPRPYTHSLLTLVVILAAALLWRRRRELLIGVAVGIAIHFWRDMAEPGSGVALLWPLSDESFSLSQVGYLLVMALAVAVGMRRSLAVAQAARG